MLLNPLSDPRFVLPARPVFAPGTSPFRGAGVIYQSLHRFIEHHLGSVDAVLTELQDDDVRRFFGQSFSRLSFYDLVPIPYIGRALARLREISFDQQLLDSNRWSARSTFFNSFAPLLKLVSIETLATALPRATAILYRFGVCRAKVVRPGFLEGVRTAVPEALVQWFCASTRHFLEVALQRAGASRAYVRFHTAEPDGMERGHPTYRVTFEILLEV